MVKFYPCFSLFFGTPLILETLPKISNVAGTPEDTDRICGGVELPEKERGDGGGLPRVDETRIPDGSGGCTTECRGEREQIK